MVADKEEKRKLEEKKEKESLQGQKEISPKKKQEAEQQEEEKRQRKEQEQKQQQKQQPGKAPTAQQLQGGKPSTEKGDTEESTVGTDPVMEMINKWKRTIGGMQPKAKSWTRQTLNFTGKAVRGLTGLGKSRKKGDLKAKEGKKEQEGPAKKEEEKGQESQRKKAIISPGQKKKEEEAQKVTPDKKSSMKDRFKRTKRLHGQKPPKQKPGEELTGKKETDSKKKQEIVIGQRGQGQNPAQTPTLKRK